MVAAHFGYGNGATAPRKRGNWRDRHSPLAQHTRAPLSEDEKFDRALVDREKFRKDKARANGP